MHLVFGECEVFVFVKVVSNGSKENNKLQKNKQREKLWGNKTLSSLTTTLQVSPPQGPLSRTKDCAFQLLRKSIHAPCLYFCP